PGALGHDPREGEGQGSERQGRPRAVHDEVAGVRGGRQEDRLGGMRRHRVAGLLAAAVVTAAGCGGGDDTSADAKPATTATVAEPNGKITVEYDVPSDEV